MIQFLLSILIVCISSNPILVTTSFTANTFSSTDGWSVFNGITGYDVKDSQSILGGNNLFGSGSRIVKNISLPPHHTIQLKVLLWALNTWENEHIIIHIDGFILTKQMMHKGYLSSVEKSFFLDLWYGHTANNIVVMFSTDLDQVSSDESWGIRDFELYIVPCPTGCLICSKTDELADCKVWNLDYNFFTATTIVANEGWYSANTMRTSSCNGNMFFGQFIATESVKHDFYMAPHYKLRLRMFLMKIDFWNDKSFYIKMNGVVVYSQKFIVDFRYPDICGTSSLNDMQKESVTKLDIELDHTDRSVVIEFLSDLESSNTVGSFGIRELQIYLAKCDGSCSVCSGPTAGECTNTTPLLESSLLNLLTSNTFTSTDSWDVIQLLDISAGSSYICDGLGIYGGLDILTKGGKAFRDYVKLPAHKRIKYVIDLYEVDHLLYKQTVTKYIDHTKSVLSVNIYSNIEADQSFGFRGIKLYIGNCDASCVTCTDTGVCITSYILGISEFTLASFSTSYGWTLIKEVPILPVTTCGGKSIVGGVGSIIQNYRIKRIFEIPAHQFIRIYMDIYIIDKWDNEKIQIKLDDEIVHEQIIASTDQSLTLCGGVAKDYILTIERVFAHSAFDAIKLEVLSNIDGSDSETWGFRNFHISYVPA